MSNIKLSFILILVISGYSAFKFTRALEKQWSYILEQYNWNSTDENVIAAPLRAYRVSKGVYGLSGTVKIGAEIDNQNYVEIRVYRSALGTSHYHLTPFRIPKVPYDVFMNNFYKKLAMNEVRNCSNMPVFDKYVGPLPIGDYHFDSCILSNDGMPTYMQLGYYKLIFELEGPLVHLVAELISKVYQ